MRENEAVGNASMAITAAEESLSLILFPEVLLEFSFPVPKVPFPIK